VSCAPTVRTHPVRRGDVSMPPVKKIIMWLIVIFLLYAILTSPTEASNIFGSIWDIIRNGVENIFKFFDSLLNR
jgi:hypothetical protein